MAHSANEHAMATQSNNVKNAEALIKFLQTECNVKAKITLEMQQQSEPIFNEKINIKSLDDEQLTELEIKLEENLQDIRQEKMKRYINNAFCIVCKKNIRNIAIMECKHLDLCDKCESKAYPKKCPRCNKDYTTIVRIKR